MHGVMTYTEARGIVLLESIAKHYRLQANLAGGLNPDNVAEAVAKTNPYMVDVREEASPGIKDPAKVQAFISQAKKIP